ncbi:MAG TPA: Mut7-C RNAse domain-containing protein [Nitrososphaeraceae archaeon]
MIRNNDYLFMADAMLGKIARKLRMFGFDTIYDPNIDDMDILASPKYKGRIVLTSDRMLFNRCRKKGIDTILTAKETEIDNLVTIFSYLNIKSIKSQNVPYLCTCCNGLLDTINDKNSIEDHIPARLLQSEKIFYLCTSCKKIYWRGTHVENISCLINEINIKLKSLN